MSLAFTSLPSATPSPLPSPFPSDQSNDILCPMTTKANTYREQIGRYFFINTHFILIHNAAFNRTFSIVFVSLSLSVCLFFPSFSLFLFLSLSPSLSPCFPLYFFSSSIPLSSPLHMPPLSWHRGMGASTNGPVPRNGRLRY